MKTASKIPDCTLTNEIEQTAVTTCNCFNTGDEAGQVNSLSTDRILAPSNGMLKASRNEIAGPEMTNVAASKGWGGIEEGCQEGGEQQEETAKQLSAKALYGQFCQALERGARLLKRAPPRSRAV